MEERASREIWEIIHFLNIAEKLSPASMDDIL
jgi:hypothetical protein